MIRLVERQTLIPNWTDAQAVVKDTIWIKPEHRNNVRLVAHEIVHVFQQRRLGMFKYWLTYVLNMIAHGYHDHPFEREARQMENYTRNHAQELIQKGVIDL